MTTQEQLEDFRRFALEQLDQGSSSLSIDELYDMWRTINPTSCEFSADVSAVQAAIRDFQGGDRGQSAGKLSARLRQRLGGTMTE